MLGDVCVTKTKALVQLQLLNIVFSLSSVAVKLASNALRDHGLFSASMLLYTCVYLGLMAIYAFFWQRVIRHVPLSSAYFNKGLVLFWSMLWAVLLLGEYLSAGNLIGIVVIFVGTILVNSDE